MPSAFVLIDIFENLEDFLSYLDRIPDVKERHRNLAVYADPPSANVYDYEVIARIDSENPGGIRTTLQRIKDYKGVKDVRILPVME